MMTMMARTNHVKHPTAGPCDSSFPALFQLPVVGAIMDFSYAYDTK